MESQIVSITKCGARVNLASNVVIIAAANPTGSFYDRTKTVSENVKISAPLMSRFDLIYRLVDQGKSSDEAFMNHLSKSKNPVSQSFFSTARSLNKEQISWLKLQPGENIDIMPTQFLQLYIGNAREKVIPTMSDEARNLIRGFFLKLHEITTGVESINITLRHLESMIRLTLARARADWADEATAEHARDVINIFKFTMVDIFADEESNLGDEESFKKPKSQNCSSLSKPKQLKAFIDHLRDLEKEEFASGELKNIAKELGIRDYYEIIDKLNHAGELLKTVDGYRVVD